MAHALDLEIEHPRGGWFPASVNIGELEARMQESFSRRGQRVLSGYFIKGSGFDPHNLLYLIVGRERTNGKSIGSGLVATRETMGDFEFDYYCKIFTTTGHSGSGAMRDMLNMARQYKNDGIVRPALLRTSDPGLSETYARYSDTLTLEINGFYVHGFGFFDKATGTELFKGASEMFERAANYVANKKRTVVPIHTEPPRPAPLPYAVPVYA